MLLHKPASQFHHIPREKMRDPPWYTLLVWVESSCTLKLRSTIKTKNALEQAVRRSTLMSSTEDVAVELSKDCLPPSCHLPRSASNSGTAFQALPGWNYGIWDVQLPLFCRREAGGRGWRPQRFSMPFLSFRSSKWIKIKGSISSKLLLAVEPRALPPRLEGLPLALV